jgi:N-acylneuraminate cytidylyltransferase
MDSMVTNHEVLAIIPARGGSKGIPRKNIRLFSGFPLIAYSIAAGTQADLVTRVILSTDDLEIADVARQFGAEVPFMRPQELAQDDTLDYPVFLHALQWLAEHEDYHPDLVVQLRPTSPLRPVGLVDQAIRKMLENPGADSLRGVVPAGENPYKMWHIDEQGHMVPILQVMGLDEAYNAPRQQLPKAYWQTGHIDVIRPRVILEDGLMSGKTILPLLIVPQYKVDIDTLGDWKQAENKIADPSLDFVTPGKQRRTWPEKISLVAFDFDGVMTDDRVWVDQDGVESVAANRGDGMGVEMLLKAGVKGVIISSETNQVVAARAQKIGLPYFYGVGDKLSTLKVYLEKEGIDPQETIYVGNDVNDLPCFPLVAWSVAVADAHPHVLGQADFILTRRGGHGAVREICDILLSRYR